MRGSQEVLPGCPGRIRVECSPGDLQGGPPGSWGLPGAGVSLGKGAHELSRAKARVHLLDDFRSVERLAKPQLLN